MSPWSINVMVGTGPSGSWVTVKGYAVVQGRYQSTKIKVLAPVGGEPPADAEELLSMLLSGLYAVVYDS